MPRQWEGSPNTHSNPILKFETQMMKPSLYFILDLIIWAAAVWSHGMPPPHTGLSHMYSGPSHVHMSVGHFSGHYSRPIHHLRTSTWEQGFTLMIHADSRQYTVESNSDLGAVFSFSIFSILIYKHFDDFFTKKNEAYTNFH